MTALCDGGIQIEVCVIMTLERKIARAFAMSDEVWALHTSPWSVWTRFTVLPLLVLAIWSRIWIGWWAVLPTAAAILWVWLNPRLFPKPRSTNNWASKAVMGERVWLNRDRVPVPGHHRAAPHLLNSISALGVIFLIWGVIVLAIWPTLFGAALVYSGKLWFLDRMVWLYEDMKNADAHYRNWLY